MSSVDPSVLDDPETPLRWIANPSEGWKTLTSIALQILIKCGNRLPWPENVQKLNDVVTRMGLWEAKQHLALGPYSTFVAAAKRCATLAREGRDDKQSTCLVLAMAESLADEMGTNEERGCLVTVRRYCGLEDREGVP